MKFKRKMTPIVALHYVKLVYRSALFVAALCLYIYNRIEKTHYLFSGFENNTVFLFCIWLVFIVEMILRFFPSRLESMGCQKQFKKNYIPTDYEVKEGERVVVQSKGSTLAVLGTWVALNGLIGAAYFLGWIDVGILILISLAYSVCDVICILFFCPFQTWFMKNKCCGSCRIYNWDYAMMFTPLLFVRSFFAQSLVVIAMILLIQWEYLLYKYPERFSEKTNCSLSCAKCHEKLCHNKSQLRSFLKKNRRYIAERPVIQKIKNYVPKKGR
ncbi:MAG: hypothetical protein J6L88_09705 [Clostridia bacterium]|nr:hypothetical protein [Clostridia bacterium]